MRPKPAREERGGKGIRIYTPCSGHWRLRSKGTEGGWGHECGGASGGSAASVKSDSTRLWVDQSHAVTDGWG